MSIPTTGISTLFDRKSRKSRISKPRIVTLLSTPKPSEHTTPIAIIAVAGKGGVGKTSISATIVKLLVKAYPDKKILAIDADPAVGLST